ncbi:TauD/TfdA dioxygenase family protein [Streptomyces albofaciens]|uniref:TauD/TfdA dioxygenase family protein n=1 Tax=Streptomyces albofaciens TaxID=66866 RepID=UPI00142EB526|nr:TauD/TfdA family dioxygenase [Streptomyces albofaciens]
MRFNNLHPRFGREVTGFDVRALDAEAVHVIRTELARCGVLVFRDQVLDDDALERASRQLGDGRLEEPARTWSHAPSTRFVSYLTGFRDESGKPLGVADNHTDYWHSDQEFRCDPATLASLYCLVPPTRGGATSFATTAVHRLSLPAELVERVRPLWSTRRPAPTHDNVDHVEVSHPVLLTSPRGDGEFLYVSENTERFIGVSDEAGDVLKAQLLHHCLSDRNVYAHEWRMGDFVVYDNAQVLHRRETFEGMRWLKGTKIFAPLEYFAVPAGEVVGVESPAGRDTGETELAASGTAIEERGNV